MGSGRICKAKRAKLGGKQAEKMEECNYRGGLKFTINKTTEEVLNL